MQTVDEVRDAAGRLEGYIRKTIGEVNVDGLGVAIEVPKPHKGSDDDDALYAAQFEDDAKTTAITTFTNVIMIGDQNYNEIYAYRGDTLFYGGIGNDHLSGEGPGTQKIPGYEDIADDGTDIAVFTGRIEHYVLSRVGGRNSDVTVEQLTPVEGESLDGKDTLTGIESIMFLGTEDTRTGEAAIFDLQDLLERFKQVSDTSFAPNPEEARDTDKSFILVGVNESGMDLTGGRGNVLIIGAGGDDTLSGGRGDDVLTGGLGRDRLDGGAGHDVLILDEGWNRKVKGETVEGGDGIDAFGYPQTALVDDATTARLFYGLARFSERDRSALDAMGDLLDRPDAQRGGGEVLGGAGLVHRLSKSGERVATDRTSGVEVFVGTDWNDTLHGGTGPEAAVDLRGADGANGLRRRMTETGGATATLRAIGATNSGAGADAEVYAAATVEGFGTLLFGDAADRIDIPFWSETLTVRAGGGDDVIDIAPASIGRPADAIVADGGAGADFIHAYAGTALGGDGDDVIRAERWAAVDGGRSFFALDGGRGDDVIRIKSAYTGATASTSSTPATGTPSATGSGAAAC